MPTDMTELEGTARDHLARMLDGVAPGDIDMDRDMADDYGLTSLDKVLFLTAVCDGARVELSHFTELDVARMRTLRDVTDALARHRNGAM
jgi:hypothetical protein